MEKKLCKRLFSVMLVLAMVLSLCPTFVFAENTIPATADFSEYTYVAFGDSIVYGVDGDTGSRMEKPYVSLVGEALGIGNVINLARSGSTWTECPPRVNMGQRAIKYNGKADIISVGLGTNDYAAKKALGDMSSRDNNTIYGSIHMVAESLTTKYPNAFIFFTTPVKYKTENNGIYTLSDVAQAVKDVAAVYDIPVLDLYNKFAWDPLTEVKDQIHPNQQHHTEKLAPLVAEFIRAHIESVSENACPCAACNGADAAWTTWDGTTAFENGKHYRLADNVQLTGVVTVPASTTVVLDLNGKTITAAADSRCFEVSGELSIVNSNDDVDADGNYTGLITGGKAAGSDAETQRGGNICVNNSAVLKLYSGTIANGTAPNAGGNVKLDDKAKFYMYGGTITAGKSETSNTVGNGGNMVVDTGALFEMHGGTISGGTTSANGGNIYTWKGTINLYGGLIADGKASSTTRGYGGNIWLNAANAKLNMYGGVIKGGEAQLGGSIYVDNASGKITMEGGEISGGKAAKHGGNIYVASGTVKMTGGVIKDGKANWDSANAAHTTATNDGGNIYLSGAKAYLGGDATVTGGSVGTATNQYGGNIYATTSGAEIYLYDQAQILGGSAYEGKNIYAMTNAKVTMYGGTVKNGNFKVGSSGSFHMYGGQVEDMVWTSSETYETVIYNGILGSNTSGLPEKLEACKAACATVAQTTHVEGHTIYAVYQTSLTNGTCATCGHTYSAANCGTCNTYSHPAVKVANCEFCNADVVWAPLQGNELVADHYYLAEDVALTGKIGLAVGDAVCIDLNGHNLTTADVTTGITMTSAKLNVTNTSADAAAIVSGGGGVLAANKASNEARSVVNFKNVTVSGGRSIENGGNIATNAVDLVIDNCIIRDGYASKNGGNICCYATDLTIKGNTQIISGFAFNNGDDLYLGTTSKAQMYSGTVDDVCQLNSTGSFHMYGGTVDKLLTYNYGSYSSSFYMYGGTINSVGVAQPDKTMANGVTVLYAGTVGNDPRIANYKDTTMVAPCSCVIETEDGYTIVHTAGNQPCEECSANDIYEGGYTFPEASLGEHTPAEAVKENVVAPSCSEAGAYDLVTYCANCGIELSRVPTVDPATGDHDYTAVVTEPTCTEKGYTTYTCACGDSYVADYVDETGHNYVGVDTPATGANNAYTTYTCDACGDSYVVEHEGTVLDFAINEQTGETYPTLQAALDAAAKGNTIKLLKDAEASELYVGAGKTLDLNGKKLTVSDSLSAPFTTTNIVDNSNGEGLLVLEDADMSLNPYNEYLPVWTNEGVRFVTASFKEQVTVVDENATAYQFYLNMNSGDTILDEILANGSAGTGLTIRIKVTYTTANGMKATQYFEMTSDMVEDYVRNWDDVAVKLTVTGTAGRSNLEYSAEIVSTAPNGSSVTVDKVDN